MGPGAKTAIALGAVALIGGAAVYALSQTKGGKFLLQTTAGPGGTISPSSASGIYKQSGEVVTIVITAASGYTIGQVLQNGSPINSSTTDTVETYQITMNMNQEIDATFYLGGQPPVGAPYSIQALNQQAIIWGYYGCKLTVGSLNTLTHVGVNTCDQNFTYGNVQQTQIQFKVIDSNGKGIPGIKVQVYPSLFPDASKYTGYLAVNSQMISQSNPAIIYSDSNGIVTVNLSYYYGLSDNLAAICKDAGLTYTVLYVLVPISYYPADGYAGGIGIPLVAKGGHGITGQTPAMGGMQPNTVIAQIIGTSIQPASCLCSCGFNIKML
jgi:hypothetical protein